MRRCKLQTLTTQFFMNLLFKLCASVVIILFCFPVNAQSITDTFYYDHQWSFCEQPVASYYRVATIHFQPYAHYSARVKDYYVTGTPEMTGTYDSSGLKEGKFVFYYKNGKVKKEGAFEKNEMKGLWSYFDSSGNLYAQLQCNSNSDFTPYFLLSNKGDTLLKNGTGTFTYKPNDYKDFGIAESESYTVSGEVHNSNRNNTFVYKIEFIKEPFCTEVYKDGKFIRGKLYNYATQSQPLSKPSSLIHLKTTETLHTEAFDHSNIVFGNNAVGDQLLINYLLKKEMPLINTKATSFQDNLFYINKVIKAVFLSNSSSISSLLNRSNIYDHKDEKNFRKTSAVLFDEKIEDENVEINFLGNTKITLKCTIDSSGFISQTQFKGKIPVETIDVINYYLSRLTNLYHQTTSDTSITIHYASKTDSLEFENHAYKKWSLIAYEDDKQLDSLQQIKSEIALGAFIQPKFAGGVEAWLNYLKRNLDASVPTRMGAPPGKYTVVVDFTVGETGELSDIKAESNPGYGTAEEAVRVMTKSPPWVPAVLNRRNVISRQKQSFTFQVSR